MKTRTTAAPAPSSAACDLDNPTLDALIALLDVFEANEHFADADSDGAWYFEIPELMQLLRSSTIGFLVHIPAYIVDVWAILLEQTFPWLRDSQQVATCLLRGINKYEISGVTRFLLHCVVQRRRLLRLQRQPQEHGEH